MTDKNTIAIEVHDMTVSYDRKPILWDIDLHLPQGKRIGVFGPNGVGKSTLFKAIMGIIPAESGYVKFFGETLDKVRNRISYVPQRQTVDWHFPVLVRDVVMMGRHAYIQRFRGPSALDKKIVQESLQQVDMLSFAQKQIGELSVGQQQRVFLARALAQKADVYLLDEPLAGVDANTNTIIFDLIDKLVQENKTVIMIHHSLETIEQHFDYIVLLNMHVRAAGPTKEIFTKERLRETYGGQLNILSEVSNLIYQRGLPIRDE